MSERISADEARRLREGTTPGPWAVEGSYAVRPASGPTAAVTAVAKNEIRR